MVFQKWIERALLIVASVLFLYTACLQGVLVSTESPLEYRESMTVLSTGLLLQNRNPYSAAVEPNFLNPYGYLSLLVNYPLNKIFGLSYPAHRVMSLFWLMASLLLVYSVLRWAGVARTWSLLGIVFLYASLGRGLSVTARPDALGLFLFLVAVLVPWRFSFSQKSLLVSVFAAVLSFYAKSYFGLAGVLVSAYLLLLGDRKRGLEYVILWLGILPASILPVKQIFEFEFYWINTIFLMSGDAALSWRHCFEQVAIFGALHVGFLVAIPWRSLSPRERYPIFLSFGTTLLLVAYMGRHTGNNNLYFQQLLSPFIVIAGLMGLSRTKRETIPRGALVASLSLLLGLTVFKRPFPQRLDGEAAYWRRFVKEHPRGYFAPPLAVWAFREGREIYDNGCTALIGNVKKLPERLHTIAKPLALRYQQDIEEKIRSRYFDVMVLAMFEVIPREVLEANYNLTETRMLPGYFNPMPAGIWKRKN